MLKPIIFAILLISSVCCNIIVQNKNQCPIIGIKLGESYSIVGIFMDKQVQIIPNEFGNKMTPSVVAFTDNDILIGQAASNQSQANPSRTIYNIKKLLGQKYSDDIIQSEIKHLPYKIVDKGDKPYIFIQNFRGQDKHFSPEQIAALILTKMKQIAEKFTKKQLKNAIITVQSYFNHQKQTSMKQAGLIAGLKIEKLMKNSITSCIAYGLNQLDQKNIIVIDMGNTLDVTILTISQGVFEVLSSHHYKQIGVSKINLKFINYLIRLINKQYEIDITDDKKAIQKLKKQIQKAKIALSSQYDTLIQIEELIQGFNFSKNITRSEFEAINSDLFKEVLEPLKMALKQANLTIKEIDKILFVGGSMQIPKIRSLIKQFFNGKQPQAGINPNYAVSYGASIQGAIICEQDFSEQIILGMDCIQLPLGIEISDGVIQQIIQKYQITPVKRSKIATINNIHSQNITIKIIQGEEHLTKNNHILGILDLNQFPEGILQIQIIFSIDQNSVLTVIAVDKNSKFQKSITISGALQDDQIERMLKQVQYFKPDIRLRQKIQSRLNLQNYIYFIKLQLEDLRPWKGQISSKQLQIVKQTISQGYQYLNQYHDAQKQQNQKKLQQFFKICDPIIQKSIANYYL